MWKLRRLIGAAAVTPLAVARRTLHAASPPNTSNSSFNTTPDISQQQQQQHVATAAPSSSAALSGGASSDSAAPRNALQPDDTEAWILDQVDRSVASGRQTHEAADYFRSIMHDQPEFHQCMQEARRLMGGQDPERLTRYQQGQFADRLCNYMSSIASEKLRRAHAEEQTTKRYSQDGTPTGENYWFEAGNTLGSPGVPGFVKDEILHEMQKDRSAKSPAYQRPPEEAQMAEEDDGYAAHLRRQRSKMFSDTDFK